MSTSNSSTLPQFDAEAAAIARDKRKQVIANSLAKRHRKEKAFKFFGFTAVLSGLFLWCYCLVVFYIKVYRHFGKPV